MQKMNEFFGYIADLLWVILAYLRGKVLRQKAYRLVTQNGLMRPPMATTVRRMIMLMRWWGLRPATLEELRAFHQPLVPYPGRFVHCIDWELEWEKTHEREADRNFRFITVRK